MTKQQLIQHWMEAIKDYEAKYTSKEKFQHMLDAGFINDKGEVLMTRAEREAGHPIDDPPLNGTVPHAPTS